MTEALIAFTAVFSASVAVLAAMRPYVRRRSGVAGLYAVWILVPAALLSLVLPTPRLPQAVAEVVLPLTSDESPFDRLRRERQQVDAEYWLGGVWLAGAVLLIASGALAQQRYRRRLQRRGRYWRAPAGAGVALLGCWPPRLVLPLDFRHRYSPIERRLVLAHERVHAQRGDNRWSLLACALLVAQWFNPLAWWAWRRFRSDQELACDAAVLRRHRGQLAPYRSALLKAVGFPSLVLATPCSSHPMIERIRMLNESQPVLSRRLILLMTVAGAGGSYVARAQPRPNRIEPGEIRVLMDLQVTGEFVGPLVHQAPVGELRSYTVKGGGGRVYELRVTAGTRPNAMVDVRIDVVDKLSGKTLGTPRLMGKDGAGMRIEMLDPDGQAPLLGVDIVARGGPPKS